MEKTIKGVIKNWQLQNGHITETVVFYADGLTTAYAEDQGLCTSRVLDIRSYNGVTICETQNSYYVLLP